MLVTSSRLLLRRGGSRLERGERSYVCCRVRRSQQQLPEDGVREPLKLSVLIEDLVLLGRVVGVEPDDQAVELALKCQNRALFSA